MPIVACPIPGCDYETENLDAAIVAALITTHSTIHTSGQTVKNFSVSSWIDPDPPQLDDGRKYRNEVDRYMIKNAQTSPPSRQRKRRCSNISKPVEFEEQSAEKHPKKSKCKPKTAETPHTCVCATCGRAFQSIDDKKYHDIDHLANELPSAETRSLSFDVIQPMQFKSTPSVQENYATTLPVSAVSSNSSVSEYDTSEESSATKVQDPMALQHCDSSKLESANKMQTQSQKDAQSKDLNSFSRTSQPTHPDSGTDVASDSDFNSVIELLGPNELEELYNALNLTSQDVEKVKKGRDTTDVNLQARAVLHFWRKVNGSKATRKRILQALKKCNNIQAKQELEDVWNEKDGLQGCQEVSLNSENNDILAELSGVLETCQEELRHYYLNSLCKIPLLPGDDPSDEGRTVNLEDIFTKLSITINLLRGFDLVKIPLTSFNEIFTYEIDGGLPKRMLVSAPSGLGKTILTAKIAYDWAKKGKPENTLLLLVLNMRWLDHTTNLEDAVFSQILPDHTDVAKEKLKNIIETLGDKVVIVLDAVDESERMLFKHPEESGSVVKLLTGKAFAKCRLLVTTRPGRISDIVRECKAFRFTKFEIGGFNKDDVKLYIQNFFSQNSHLGDSLIEYIEQNEIPVIAEETSVPLMVLLVCLYWKDTHVPGKELPNRICHLYDDLIMVLFQRRQENLNDILPLVHELGKMAIRWMWPPENETVIALNETSDFTERACRIGLLCKQIGSNSSVFRKNLRTSVTFLHKSFGEKCTGEYFANLAEENPKLASDYLQKLSTVKEPDVLSIQRILRFASGANSKAADQILQRLMKIFQSELQQMTSEYYAEELELKDVMKIQKFIEMCLRCNYEADNEGKFNALLLDLFHEGNVLFLGISASTAEALGYYISHSPCGHILSITLRPTAHAGDNIKPVGALRKLHDKANKEIQRQTPKKMKDIERKCEEYCKKHQGIHHGNKKMVSLSPARMLSRIALWEACEKAHLPTAEASNIGPIIKSFQHTELQKLDIGGFKIGENKIDQLLEAIHESHLSHLIELGVGNIGMSEGQTEELAIAISSRKMPLLEVIDISQNEAGESLQVLAESLPLLANPVQKLDVHQMKATEEQMGVLIQNLPNFMTGLVELDIDGNEINDKVASVLTKILPEVKLLKKLRISVRGLSGECHNQLLSAIHHLSGLQDLRIFHSKYPDDLMVIVADEIESLPDLDLLTLQVDKEPQDIKSATWQHFRARLESMIKLKNLVLLNIKLGKDFQELVQLCRRMEYREFSYNLNCMPEILRHKPPRDDFFRLL